MNLMTIINRWFATVMLQYHPRGSEVSLFTITLQTNETLIFQKKKWARHFRKGKERLQHTQYILWLLHVTGARFIFWHSKACRVQSLPACLRCGRTCKPKGEEKKAVGENEKKNLGGVRRSATGCAARERISYMPRETVLVFKSSNGYWLGARPECTAEGGRHPHVTTWERKLDKDDRA